MSVFHGTRPWLYPMKARGRFARLHKASSFGLILLLLVLPWLRWRGQPLLLADVGARRLTAFGAVFTAADGVLVMLLALAAAFGLFFFTTVLGRLWCGYVCPQSVFWINVALPVERWIEGDHQVRRRRDQGPLTLDRAWRKVAKWTVYAVFAFVVSMSFAGLFVPAAELWTGAASGATYGIVGFFTTLWFLDFAWYREQVCNYVCPYARFQGALTDDHSLVISYDVPRGEPRGRPGTVEGSCVDCRRCVQVCPQGIDIRDGFQLECIACGLCIDACTTVAEKRGFEPLIRYSTLAADQGRPGGLVRPRVFVYGGALAVLLGAIVGLLATHEPLELQVDRAPGSLWIEDEDGFVRNTYMVHVTDRRPEDGTRAYAVAVEGLPERAQIRATPVLLARAERKSVPLVVRVPRSEAARTLPLTVRVRGADVEVAQPTVFAGPGTE